MKKILYYFVPAVLLSGLVSCEAVLKENPDSYYTREDFFTNTANASMAVTGIYNMLSSCYSYIDGQTLPCGDDCYYPSGITSDNGRRDIGFYRAKPSHNWLENAWAYKYEQLNRANYCIANIEKMAGYAGNVRLQQLVGEAKFLRAQAAYDLVKYWGDVPFKTTYSSDYTDAYIPRSPREDIYGQMVTDLNDAKAVLPWATAETSPETVTQGAARALLMRVLLTRAGYSLQMDGTLSRPADEERKTYFEAVIEEWKAFGANGCHGFYDGGFEALFKSFSAGRLNSRESLFEVAFDYPVNNGFWGTYLGPLVAEPKVTGSETANLMGRAQAFYRAVPEWRHFFEAGDRRRDVTVCTYQYRWDDAVRAHVKKENNAETDWYPGKWRREWMPPGYEDLNSNDVNYCMLRYADVVLMAAEAYNEIGETTQAWGLLNKVRARAGATEVASYAEYRAVQPALFELPFFDGGSAGDDFRAALFWERGFELAYEGQRKIDLIRWGVLGETLRLFAAKTSVNDAKTTRFLAGGNFKDGHNELFPIPEDEMQVNYQLKGINNPGY